MAQDITSPLDAIGEEHTPATPDPNPKRDTADQRWIEDSDKIFWRFLVPILILMLATVTAAAFYIANQDWMTMATTPDLDAH